MKVVRLIGFQQRHSQILFLLTILKLGICSSPEVENGTGPNPNPSNSKTKKIFVSDFAETLT